MFASLQNSNRTRSVIQMEICNTDIMLSVYKSNMTIMPFQQKRNIDVLSPRRRNVEITSNRQ